MEAEVSKQADVDFKEGVWLECGFKGSVNLTESGPVIDMLE